jgi:hypothetical protein
MADEEATRVARKQKIFRACMFGLMAGSGTFLALRYALRIDVDSAMVVGAGIGVAVGVFLLKQVDRN